MPHRPLPYAIYIHSLCPMLLITSCSIENSRVTLHFSDSMVECMKVPPWVEHILSTTFFSLCEIHTKHKNECNKYCIDCRDEAFCSDCIPTSHEDHHVIQIRRSSYQQCVRMEDLKKALDINGVQTFVINSAKVVFLNKRGRCVSQTNKNGGSNFRNNLCKNTTECMTCERSLLEPFCFCSIECKLEWIRKDESGRFVLSVKNNKEVKTMHGEMPTLTSKEKDKELEEETNKEVSQSVIAPPPAQPPRPVSYNSRKRKGIPRRAPFF